MRYTKVQTPTGPTYAIVVGDQITASRPGPEEDPLPAQPLTPGPVASFQLLPPVKPSKIVCIGRNYRDHATELGNDVPTEPLLFLKPPSSLLGAGGIVRMPAISKRIDFEGELGLVIGKTCTKIGKDEDVAQYIRGYVIVNDVTARDIQKSDPQWTRGKGYDTFCPTGPWVSDEIDPLTAPVTVTTHLNEAQKQSGSTADFIFTIPELLRYITACMTLNPGDLIPTGTPAGVGPMQSGDMVSVAIEGLGTLTNTLAAE